MKESAKARVLIVPADSLPPADAWMDARGWMDIVSKHCTRQQAGATLLSDESGSGGMEWKRDL